MVKCKDGPYVCHEQHAEIVAALAADKQAADRATFDAIRAFTVLKDEVAALQAENELLKEACENNLGRIDALFIRLRELQAENDRLRKEVETWKFLSTHDGIACNERARENQDLENKIERLKDEVDMLRKADRLVVWNGKEWEVRFSLKNDPVKQ